MNIGGKWEGINILHTDPGAEESLSCKACGMEMEVHRSVIGATQRFEAMAEKEHEHDLWFCVNNRLDWHALLVNLSVEQSVTSSPSLKAFIQQDINAIKTEHIAGE